MNERISQSMGPAFKANYVRVLYVAMVLVFFALLLTNHVNMLVLPTPLDIYEGLMPQITGLIARGENPYTYEYQPVFDDFYPPLYNILVAPFTWVFENDYQLHRGINAVLIALSCAICYFMVVRQQRHAKAHGLAAAVLLYAALIYYSTPVSSTNALGVLLMMLTAIIPWRRGFDLVGLAIALVLGVLAFFAKQYFACSAAALAIYLFLFENKRVAVVFAIAYLGLLIAALAVVHSTSPYFLDNTLWAVIHASSPIRSADVLLGQLAEFLRLYAGVLVLLLYALGVALWQRSSKNNVSDSSLVKNRKRGSLFNVRCLSKPLLEFSFDYFWFHFLFASVLIVVALGWHPANYMSYLFQLMSPFFLIAAFRVFSAQRNISFLALPLLGYSFFHTWEILWKDFDVDQSQWHRAEELIQNHDNILASQVLLLPLIKHDKEINLGGHTFYFKPAKNKPDMFKHSKPSHQVSAIWNDYMADLYHQVENRKFDVVMLHTWDIAGVFLDPPAHVPNTTGPDYFKRFYKRTEVIRLSLTKRPGGGNWPIQVWVPKD